MTPGEIQTVAQNAGFAGADLATAVAIARAESSGDPTTYDPETAFFAQRGMVSGELGSYGLWQIFRYEHPEFDGWNLSDPQVNACAANLIYAKRGKSFEPWSTFTSGRYRQYLESEAT